MKDLITDAIGYIKDVFAGGIQWLFTSFDVLGLLTFFCKNVAEILSTDESVTRTVGGSILLLSFTLANFNLYRKLAVGSRVAISHNNGYTKSWVLNLGPGTIKDLEVSISYCDENGRQIEYPVTTLRLSDGTFARSVIRPEQEVHFKLPDKDDVVAQKVEVLARYTVVESG